MSARIDVIGRIVDGPSVACGNEHLAASAAIAVSLSNAGGDNLAHRMLVVAVEPTVSQLTACSRGDLVRIAGALIAHKGHLVISADAIVTIAAAKPRAAQMARDQRRWVA